MEQKIRMKIGARAGIAAMALNLMLATAKIAVGILSGLVSLVADGVNNLSDCGSGAVSLISFRIAARPADREHPFGHRRAEYVAALIVSFLVLFLGAELLLNSVRGIFESSIARGSLVVYLLLGISVLVKAGMGGVFLAVSKKISSDVLRATAIDSFSDCLATAVVILGLVIADCTGFAAEGYAGAIVALFILWEGFLIARDAGSKLLGRAPDPSLIDKIRGVLLTGNVLGVHDLRVYPYGPDTHFATVHIEMDASMSAIEAHEVLDELERKVFELCAVRLTAHLDPVDLADTETKELEERVRASAEGMVDGLNLHDFRLVRGGVKKLVFEAGVPFSCKRADDQIKDDLCRIVRILGDYEPLVMIERE